MLTLKAGRQPQRRAGTSSRSVRRASENATKVPLSKKCKLDIKRKHLRAAIPGCLSVNSYAVNLQLQIDGERLPDLYKCTIKKHVNNKTSCVSYRLQGTGIYNHLRGLYMRGFCCSEEHGVVVLVASREAAPDLTYNGLSDGEDGYDGGAGTQVTCKQEPDSEREGRQQRQKRQQRARRQQQRKRRRDEDSDEDYQDEGQYEEPDEDDEEDEVAVPAVAGPSGRFGLACYASQGHEHDLSAAGLEMQAALQHHESQGLPQHHGAFLQGHHGAFHQPHQLDPFQHPDLNHLDPHIHQHPHIQQLQEQQLQHQQLQHQQLQHQSLHHQQLRSLQQQQQQLQHPHLQQSQPHMPHYHPHPHQQQLPHPHQHQQQYFAAHQDRHQQLHSHPIQPGEVSPYCAPGSGGGGGDLSAGLHAHALSGLPGGGDSAALLCHETAVDDVDVAAVAQDFAAAVAETERRAAAAAATAAAAPGPGSGDPSVLPLDPFDPIALGAELVAGVASDVDGLGDRPGLLGAEGPVGGGGSSAAQRQDPAGGADPAAVVTHLHEGADGTVAGDGELGVSGQVHDCGGSLLSGGYHGRDPLLELPFSLSPFSPPRLIQGSAGRAAAGRAAGNQAGAQSVSPWGLDFDSNFSIWPRQQPFWQDSLGVGLL